MTPSLQLHLDLPVAIPMPAHFAVQGWVASQSPVLRVFAGEPAGGRTLAFVERPDVRAALPGFAHTTGFIGQANADDLRDQSLLLTVVTAEGEQRVRSPLLPALFAAAGPPPDFAVSPEMKARKINRLAGRLACTVCQAPLPALDPRCPACGAAFEFSATMLDFMSPAQRATVPAVGETGDSVGGYDEVNHALIHRFADGLILDCGAGLKGRIYPNVVNLEIMAYPSTDVRAFNESLPFVAGTFDAVFTHATLEHVRDPFASGREIMRVLQPGGIVYSMVPLLVPFHGYPNHYYNMTIEGHKNVFGPQLEVLATDVPLSGNPMWALSGLLRAWHRGLAPSARGEFLDLRIGDLLDEPLAYRDRDFVRHLHPTVAMEIAAMTRVIGRKLA